ncbi:MAG: type II toxin-antitoxin system VapC family toxin [Gammaproteobacteria bacterium]|nr:type II toxin-antitoxin system VapC family toxin [Gammaproteobacteria bacterium]MBU1980161.1 type II toxin-antitoxin system VapC family toxin [Gammaproteobacteria bacterium]
MNLLLDSHVFLWLMNEPERVPDRVLVMCENGENALYLSVASIWELQIKHALGKLTMRLPLKQILDEQQQGNGMGILPIKLPHLWRLTDLPQIHGDPFDRLLIAQAVVEDMHLISADRVFSSYPVKLFW